MNKSLTVIIPVSKHESLETIQSSINVFKKMDFGKLDEKIVYAIDVPDDTRQYYQNLKLGDNMELLWVHDTSLKQAGAYNAGLEKYPDSDYYSFYDVDAIPSEDFFKECAQIDANIVSCDRFISNPYQNSVTETIAEEYAFCNCGRRMMHKYVGKFFPASCTALISGITLRDFRFTEKTSADTELYRHLLLWDYSFGYAKYTFYMESSPTSLKQLYSQRVRWLSDTWRTFVRTVGSGNSWKVNIANLLMYTVGMFPIVAGIAAIPHAKHIKGYNIITHLLYMHYISAIALANTIRQKDIKWEPVR